MSNDDRAASLAPAAYRYKNDAWYYLDDEDGWVRSNALDGYNEQEGIAVIAQCNWATIAEPDHT